jgi:hypothetical protein
MQSCVITSQLRLQLASIVAGLSLVAAGATQDDSQDIGTEQCIITGTLQYWTAPQHPPAIPPR